MARLHVARTKTHIYKLDLINGFRYYLSVIKSFASKETEQLWQRNRPKHIPSNLHKIALRKLYILDAAMDINDLRVPPGNRLEKLKGRRKDQHSIRINDQWRICFLWMQGNAYDVEIIDYH